VQGSGKKILTTWIYLSCQLLTLANAEFVQKVSFQVQVLGKSNSGKIYLFQTPDPPATLYPGKVMLLQETTKPIMAFQILKIQDQKNMFLGKRIRRYQNHRTLGTGNWYQAIQIQPTETSLPIPTSDALDAWEFPSPQKIQLDDLDIPDSLDIPFPTHKTTLTTLNDPLSPQKIEDLNDTRLPTTDTLDNPIPSVDPLDLPILKTTSLPLPLPESPQVVSIPQPLEEKKENPQLQSQKEPATAPQVTKKIPDTFPFDDLEKTQPTPLFDSEDQSDLGEATDERSEFDPNSQSLSVGLSFVANNASSNTLSTLSITSTNTNPIGNPTGGKQFFSAGSIRYAMRIKKRGYLHSLRIQDSITAELSLHLYKVLGYISESDAYSILGMMPTLRYNVFFSENLGIFAYLGFLRNAVLSATQSTDTGLAGLNSFYIASGVGLFLKLGPSWYARTDLGLESIGFSLVLQF
jgi:hypothetical protein